MCNIVVIDLEMCKVPKAMRNKTYHWANETIQIGAVLVDENYEIVDEFSTYVKPKYGSIDGFIKKLTGITNYDISEAPDMETALQMFAEWVPDDAVCTSWSDSDEMQIRHEMQGKNIQLKKMDKLLENWEDCQKTFSEKIKEKKKYNLKEALIAADIFYDENLHNGLVDAKNTAMLYIKMQKEPELKLNKYYCKAKFDVEYEEEKSTLGDLFPWMQNFAVTA